MKRQLSKLIFALGCLASLNGQAGWQLTFADEFSGSTLDSSKWIPTDGWGNRGYPAHGELQCYTPNNFTFSGGILSITARREYSSSCLPSTASPMNYTSGMISTAQSFQQQFGYYEIRARLPKGNGLWPAFWTLPADKTISAEVDIMEAIGSIPTSVFLALHYYQGDQYLHSAGWFAGPDFSAAFHTFGIDWQPGVITFYGDGIARHVARTSGVPNKAMYLIANLAVGGSWPGNPDASTPFPSTLQIDYIRAYQRVNNGQPDAVPPFGVTESPPTISLLRSVAADRSNAVQLSGAQSGKIYVFVPDSVEIARVDFSIDGKIYHTENMAPWDLAGTGASAGTALPFDTATLTSGTHTISARATLKSGAALTKDASINLGSISAASGILLSYSPDRSNAVDLNGRTVSGSIYIFVPSTGVSRVAFLVDGKLVKNENLAPFDLAGTATTGNLANAFNASGLSAGTHSIQAQITWSNGSSSTASATVYR